MSLTCTSFSNGTCTSDHKLVAMDINCVTAVSLPAKQWKQIVLHFQSCASHCQSCASHMHGGCGLQWHIISQWSPAC